MKQVEEINKNERKRKKIYGWKEKLEEDKKIKYQGLIYKKLPNIKQNFSSIKIEFGRFMNY